MKRIENVVIGTPLVALYHLLGRDEKDVSWKEATWYTNERYLPRILVDLGLVPSTNWVRKNKPELNIELNKSDFLEVRVSKKKMPIWIVVGK